MKISRHPVRVHWGDTDPAAIVYYPNYFRWFDQGTTTLFESVGLDWHTLTKRFGVIGMPIVEVKSRFVAPCRFRDSLVVESKIAKWTSRTFQIDHTILNGETIAVHGYELRVLAKPHPEDASRIQSSPIPEEFRKIFE